jgi:hypothetical protein
VAELSPAWVGVMLYSLNRDVRVGRESVAAWADPADSELTGAAPCAHPEAAAEARSKFPRVHSTHWQALRPEWPRAGGLRAEPGGGCQSAGNGELRGQVHSYSRLTPVSASCRRKLRLLSDALLVRTTDQRSRCYGLRAAHW